MLVAFACLTAALVAPIRPRSSARAATSMYGGMMSPYRFENIGPSRLNTPFTFDSFSSTDQYSQRMMYGMSPYRAYGGGGGYDYVQYRPERYRGGMLGAYGGGGMSHLGGGWGGGYGGGYGMSRFGGGWGGGYMDYEPWEGGLGMEYGPYDGWGGGYMDYGDYGPWDDFGGFGGGYMDGPWDDFGPYDEWHGGGCGEPRLLSAPRETARLSPVSRP